jgi:excisionase family DNA binding protein
MAALNDWLTVQEAVELLEEQGSPRSGSLLRRLARKGEVSARKVGATWLLNRDDLLDYVRRMDAAGPAKFARCDE